MKIQKYILVLTLALLTGPQSFANTLFEGWFEVFIGEKKVGFLVERYEFADNKFKATKYLKTFQQ